MNCGKSHSTILISKNDLFLNHVDLSSLTVENFRDVGHQGIFSRHKDLCFGKPMINKVLCLILCPTRCTHVSHFVISLGIIFDAPLVQPYDPQETKLGYRQIHLFPHHRLIGLFCDRQPGRRGTWPFAP
jgi:hypothetical protein